MSGTGNTRATAPNSGDASHHRSDTLPPAAVALRGTLHAGTPASTASANVGSIPALLITRESRPSGGDPGAPAVVGAPTTGRNTLAQTGSGISDSIPLGLTLTGSGLVLVELARRRRRRN